MIHQNNAHSHARPRFVFVNGQTTTDVFFLFLRAYVFLYEHNSQTLSKASARGSIMTGSMPTTAVLENKRKKIKKFIER